MATGDHDTKEGNYGFLYPNKRRDRNSKQPVMTGRLTIDGVEWEIAAWNRTSRKGERYLSLRAETPQQAQPKSEDAASQDDLPF